MTRVDFLALLPLAVLMAAAVVVMLAAAFVRSHALAAALAMIGLAAALAALPVAAAHAPRQVTPLAIIDGYALFFIGLICAAALGVALLAYDYFRVQPGRPEEFYVLLLLATLGAAVLAASNHFASFFLGLEVLSVALYALIAYRRTSPVSIEAGVKYLVLAATSAAILLFGMALVYAEAGRLDFARAAIVYPSPRGVGVILPAGVVLVFVGVGFKLALAPFHFWTPDVYQGAPAPVAAFVATVSKGAMFALLLRLFRPFPPDAASPLWGALAVLAVASMFTGNLLALRQDNIKRLLAYSSISQLGYLLVALLAGGPLAEVAVAYFLVAYMLTMLGAFGVVSILSDGSREAEDLADYRGLAWRRPWVAGVLTAMLLSLAGIPLTAGFIGKFYVLAAGGRSGLWWLAGAVVVNSAIGLYYYLRVVAVMVAAGPETSAVPRPAWLGYVALAVTAVLLVWLGIYPGPLVALVEKMLL